MKLPEPVYKLQSNVRHVFANQLDCYSEAQMRQAIRDAVEEAAKVCENMERNGAWITKLEAATAIRKLKETI